MTFRNIMIVCMVLALFSCSKDQSAETPGNSSNDTAGYQPVTAGSAWHYKDAVNPKGGFTLTATDRDTVMDNITFTVFNRKPDTSDRTEETYFAQDHQNYYAVGLIQTLGDNAILYLKDTTVNSTWTQDISLSYSGVSIQVELDFTLVKAGISKKINAKTYKNIAQVSFVAKAQVAGTSSQMAAGELYLSRGVGIIAVKFTEGASVISDISLDSYTVK